MKRKKEALWKLLGMFFKAHPWHGVEIGDDFPRELNVYIELVPTDTVKYELDKETGHLKLDRPQMFSNVCPALYGFVPQTLCGKKVGAFTVKKTGRSDLHGDNDPLDICVLTEKQLSHGDIIVKAIPLGGLRLLDRGEADDKIIAVLRDDAVYGGWTNLSDMPQSVLDRLMHYFVTYKYHPGSGDAKCEIAGVYDRDEAWEIINLAHEDYTAKFDMEEE